MILEIPVLPVWEGDDVSLHCRGKTPISNLKADFYKDDVLMESSPAGEMKVNNVSKSVAGFYKCSIPGVGESPGSWLAVRGKMMHCFRLKSSAPNLTSPIKFH